MRQTLRVLLASFCLVTLALAACSETELRVIYEAPVITEQPDALGPTQWTDTFQQRTVEQSDILFVVDDSCSMGGEQATLAANFDNFIQSFSGGELDFHIGVTRSALTPGLDNSDEWGLLEPLPDGSLWIDADTADPVDAFNSIANVGTDGGDCEMGLEASFSALHRQAGPGQFNEGFYREDALLTLVVISDEIDHGPDEGQTFDFLGMSLGTEACEGIAPDEFIPWFLYSLKGSSNQEKLIFTAIVGDRPGGCSEGDNSADEGAGYWDVVDGVGGHFLSICSPDWSEFLTELGLEAAGLKTSFHLRRVPVDGTLVVTIDGVEPDPATWSYNRVTNSIDFPLEHVPAELSVLVATYQLAEDTGASVPVE